MALTCAVVMDAICALLRALISEVVAAAICAVVTPAQFDVPADVLEINDVVATGYPQDWTKEISVPLGVIDSSAQDFRHLGKII